MRCSNRCSENKKWRKKIVFNVDVPLGAGGEGGGAGGASETNKLLKKLDKSIIATFDPLEILTQAFQGVIKLLQPLVQILSILFLVIFLPLLPIIKELVKVFSGLIKLFTGEINIVEFIKGYLIPAIKAVINAIWEFLVGWWKAIFDNLVVLLKSIWEDILLPAFEWLGEQLGAIAIWIWENIIQPAFSFLASVGMWIWNQIIKPAFDFLISVGSWIWNQIIKPAFEFLADVGTKIWNILKVPFDWLADKIKGIWDMINPFGGGSSTSVEDAIISPNGNVITTHPEDFLIATKTPGSLLGAGKSPTININNPIVRNTSDIKNIANEVSKVLMRETRGRGM